jgi:outer membrane protein OmpA-like peptidoglycan-associated protein
MRRHILHLIVIIFLGSNIACVGTKKYKALETEKNKLENTLLDIKTNLATAKLELNKLEDESSMSAEKKSSKIDELKEKIALCESVLQTTQSERVALAAANQKMKGEIAQVKKENEVTFKPFSAIQSAIIQDNQRLNQLQDSLLVAYTNQPALKLNVSVNRNELVLLFDYSFLFSSTGKSLSSEGRSAVYTLAAVLEKEQDVLIEIKGYSDLSTDKNANWKTSSRKPLSIVYELMNKGISDKRIKVSYYGPNRPLVTNSETNNTSLNNRTEIILYYSSGELLKTIPIK